MKVLALLDPEAGGRQEDGGDDPATGIFNPFWIGDQAGGTETSGYLDGWSPAPSVWAIQARHAGDVAAGVDFAREHGLRLVVKGTGHSYLGNSNAPTRCSSGRGRCETWRSTTPAPAGVRSRPGPGRQRGAGAMWVDLYDAITNKGCPYVQGGGLGVFFKRYGTAAAALIEAEIVTADGRIRTVNASHNPELF